MILPKNASRDHKIRDAKICALYVRESLTHQEIAERFKLTPRRVGQIIYDNRDFIEIDKKHEKLKRLHKLDRILKNTPEYLSKGKDALDVLEAYRKELEGNGNTTVIQNTVTIPKLDDRDLAELIAFARSRTVSA